MPSSEKIEQQKQIEEEKALKISLMKELEELEILLQKRLLAVESKSECAESPTMHELPAMHEAPPVEVVKPAVKSTLPVLSLVLRCPFCLSAVDTDATEQYIYIYIHGTLGPDEVETQPMPQEPTGPTLSAMKSLETDTHETSVMEDLEAKRT